MTTFKRRALAAALMMPLHAWCAPATPPDRIDSQLERCLDDAAHQSTAGQTDCIGTANRAWDQRMNRAYDQLIHTLPAQAAASLRSAQRAWLTFRDAEFRAQSELFATRRGTMYVPMQADAALTTTRDRARQLESQIDVLRIDGP